MGARCDELLSVELQLCSSREAALPEGIGRASQSAFVADNGASPIGERAATRGAHRNGGGGERVGAKGGC